MSIRYLLAVLAACCVSWANAQQCQPQRSAPAAIKGVWVASHHHNKFWDSADEMRRQMAEWRAIGINTVFLAVWNQGRTSYPSAVAGAVTGKPIDERFVGRDPLAEALQVARALDMKLMPWFEFGFASDYKGGGGSELRRLKPEWVALDAQGKPAEKNGFFWLNGFDPEVQDFLHRLVMEVVQRYEVDGIQGDDRLPAQPVSAGYDPRTRQAYAAEHGGRQPPQDARDRAWKRWRADRLNAFVQRLNTAAKAVRPQLHLSLSPSPYPWGYDEYLQDWPTWLRQGWVDSLSPQLYRYQAPAYRKTLDEMLSHLPCPEDRARMFPGVLLSLGREYVAAPDLLRSMVQANREAGLQGEVFFHSEGLTKRGADLKDLLKGERR